MQLAQQHAGIALYSDLGTMPIVVVTIHSVSGSGRRFARDCRQNHRVQRVIGCSQMGGSGGEDRDPSAVSGHFRQVALAATVLFEKPGDVAAVADAHYQRHPVAQGIVSNRLTWSEDLLAECEQPVRNSLICAPYGAVRTGNFKSGWQVVIVTPMAGRSCCWQL